MRNCEYVFYGKINIKLSSFLHIGGEEETFFSMVTNGDGQFILPASSIAGAVRAYIKGLGLPADKYMGSSESVTESRICFYDAPCHHVAVEKRNGIKKDEEYGVAATDKRSGKLYSDFYIGEGMTCELWVQAYASSEEECQELVQMFYCMQWGIHSEELTLGAKKSNGAGIFKVLKAEYQILDLKKAADFAVYLSGVEQVFESLKGQSFDTQVCLTKCSKDMSPKTAHRVEFELVAEIPDGILVKSGANGITESRGSEGTQVDDLNVRKLVDGKVCYYIPGSTVKGAIRGYAQKVCNYFRISNDVVQQMFGGLEEAQKYRSHVKAQDVVIEKKETAVYHRIKIDRWLGGTINSAMMQQEVVSTKEGATINIKVMTDMSDSKRYPVLNGLVFLALRDMGLGLVPIGSSSGIGFGRLKGRMLKVNGSVVRFEDRRLVFEQNEFGNEAKEMLQGWLQGVEKYAV